MTNLITYVALLRGINVGGNTLINMAELKACFEGLGLYNVKTYINSGNIIFRSNMALPRDLEKLLEAGIRERFNFDLRIIVLNQKEIAALIQQVPKSWLGPISKKCNVIFLHHSIDSPEILKNFSPKPDIEELHYHPGVLFWSAQTSALTKSTMLKVSASPLYKDMTVRIYNTVKKIYAIMQQIDQLPDPTTIPTE
jgi:uncharacterized protein (DUF1697 family)